MLAQSLIAAAVVFTSLVSADSNALRFARGLPPLPQKFHKVARRAVAAGPSAVPLPNVPVSALLVQTAASTVPDLQYNSALSQEYNSYALSPVAPAQALAGTFVYTGYLSTANRRPLYTFRPIGAPETMPYMVLSFPNADSTVDDMAGAYMTQGGGSGIPAAPSALYPLADPTSNFGESAVFQLDKSNPAAPVLSFLSIDSNGQEHLSNLCIDGLGSTSQIPFLWSDCPAEWQAIVTLKLA